MAAQYVCGLRRAAQLKSSLSKVGTDGVADPFRTAPSFLIDLVLISSAKNTNTHQRDEALVLLKKQLRQQHQRHGAVPIATGKDEAGGQATAAAAAAAMAAAAAAATTAATGTVPRGSKLRLYVTLPDGACTGVLASPLMPVSR